MFSGIVDDSPNKHFLSFSNKQKLDKNNEKIFRPTDPNVFLAC